MLQRNGLEDFRIQTVIGIPTLILFVLNVIDEGRQRICRFSQCSKEKDEPIEEKSDQSKGQQAYSEFVEEMAEHSTPQRRQIKPEMSVIVTLDMVGVKHEL